MSEQQADGCRHSLFKEKVCDVILPTLSLPTEHNHHCRLHHGFLCCRSRCDLCPLVQSFDLNEAERRHGVCKSRQSACGCAASAHLCL